MNPSTVTDPYRQGFGDGILAASFAAQGQTQQLDPCSVCDRPEAKYSAFHGFDRLCLKCWTWADKLGWERRAFPDEGFRFRGQ